MTLKLTQEDHDVIRNFLLSQKSDKNPHPLMAADVDLDGDGICDAYGLSKDNRVILVSGASLTETTYESDGNDIKAGLDG